MQTPVDQNQDELYQPRADLTAPILAGAILLLSLTLLALAQTLAGSTLWTGLILGAALCLPGIAALISKSFEQSDLEDWFWGAFVIATLVIGLFLVRQSPNTPPSIGWGAGAMVALGISALFRSNIALTFASAIAGAWVWFAYTSNPPVDFLWSFLLVFSAGLALCMQFSHKAAAIGFALGLLLWTVMTAQVALTYQVAGSSQIAFFGSLFLLTAGLLSPHGHGGIQIQMPWHRVVLFTGSALGAAFAVSPFASSAGFVVPAPGLYVWWALGGGILVCGVLALVFGQFTMLDELALLALLILLLFGVFGLPLLHPPLWWKSVGAGVLSMAGIWMASRGLSASDRRAGLAGLGIWAAAVLLSSHGIEQNWVKAAVLGLFSLVAVGFYLNSEQQFQNRQRKSPL
jgi:hypothetical protein